MKHISFPKGVKLHHKIDQRTVELGFEGKTVDDILAACSNWPEEIRIMQKGKTASIVIDAPPIDMAQGIADQLEAIEAALAIAKRLADHGRILVGG